MLKEELLEIIHSSNFQEKVEKFKLFCKLLKYLKNRIF